MVLFLARSWHGYGGMQRLNRDVVGHMAATRGDSFKAIYPKGRSIIDLFLFCIQSMTAAWTMRGRDVRIHTGDAAALPLGILCAWIAKGSLSTTACGLDVIYTNSWYQSTLQFCLRRCARVLCISDATADEVRQRGVSAEKIVVIPCGIDATDAPSQIQRDPHLLVTVGRLVRRKGVVWFLEHVFPRLLTDHPQLKYVIIGNGPEKERIESIITRLHLDDAVSVWPHASDETRQSILDTGSVFIAPNIHVDGDMEGFGIVCLEAGERGLQVAAANIEGLSDAIIDNQTGRLFTSGNTDDCIRMIDEMLKHPLDPTTVQQATLHHFSWNRLIPLYNDVFDS
jgi:glycosyltransferase involved in cell wall biosynthesis